MDLNKIEEEFNKYVNKFDLDNFDINYKYKHSYRVEKLSGYLAKELKLSDEDIKLASVIGLFHDIGRFKQLEKFKSYKDKNIDHALLGAKILFDDGLIDSFDIDNKYYDTIRIAIENHNKIKLEDIPDDKLLQCEIVRDADKLDILKAFTIYRDYKLRECEDDITKEAKEAFFNNKTVDVKDEKNLNDKIVLVLSFVYDVNFYESLKYIKDNKLIELLYDGIEHKEIFEPYYTHIMNYLNERMIQDVR